MKRSRLAALSALAAAGALAGPCATWLQGRERWVFPRAAGGLADARPDLVYLVAGERDQDRRISAVASYVQSLPAPADRAAAPGAPDARIFTGHERACGPFSRTERRNLEVGEWAARKLGTLGLAASLVPGRFNGTDGEMAALAAFLRDRPDVRTLAVCTSAFHVRRVLWRLRKHLDRDRAIVVICASPRWNDRAPWTVLAELGKMGRDALGLSHAPVLSRGPVTYPEDGSP